MLARKVAVSVAGAWTVLLMVSASPLAIAADSAPGKIPDLAGPWQNLNRFKLVQAPSGPKIPTGDLAGYVHSDRGVDARGQDFSGNFYVGDYTSPLYTAWGQGIMKHNAEEAMNEKDPFWPATFCYPFGPTALLQPQPVIFLQQPDKVVINYERDHQIRHVFLNVEHSTSPKPSWYGESVGHYEGDTLVVDTIGFNAKAFLDRYGAPYSEQLHMIERYKVSPDGRAMQVDVTYDDPKAYKQSWNAVIRYRKGQVMPTEEACAESAEDPVNGGLNPIPVAAKADF
jgi:hypothetical protein